MILRQAVRRLLHRRSLALAALILAVSAGTAVAAVITGGNSDNTLIGTPQNDTISDGNGNDVVYGLAGADTIYAGNGNDVIDGDGHCTQGTAASYCSHGPIPGDGGDTIYAGNGNDTIFGGGGNNTISVGTGVDTIYGGPLNDTISAGTGSNQGQGTVYLGSGSNTVSVGGGNYTVNAFHSTDTNKDVISCANSNSIAYVNKQDVVKHCRTVLGARRSAGTAARSRHHRSHKSKRHRMTF